ncbi:hypothetical protein [Lysobacter gummosus]|uniref:hypothetical protein n=1 Tax=Lysobacter gummosus TaxID=262324 RepID=UPI00362B0D33
MLRSIATSRRSRTERPRRPPSTGTAIMQSIPDAMHAYLPARISASADLPWIPSSTPGKYAKPLRFSPTTAASSSCCAWIRA